MGFGLGFQVAPTNMAPDRDPYKRRMICQAPSRCLLLLVEGKGNHGAEVPYNPYNHAFPWFGIRWYHATGRCMQRRWRYSFLLGDIGALVFQEPTAGC